MKITLGGVRGTAPVTGADVVAYGGETTSFMIEGQQGDLVLIDCGTGIRNLDGLLTISSRNNMLMLMTHYHIDHVIGFPYFSCIYGEQYKVRILGPTLGGYSAEQIFAGMMSKPFWPLQLDELHAEISFGSLPNNVDTYKQGALEVRWCALNHPGGCRAYRLDEEATGASVVIATDLEWQATSEHAQQTFIQFCAKPEPASLLIFDSHYTPENIADFQGWGHSTWLDGIQIARAGGIPKVLMTHHAPYHNDQDLARIDTEVHNTWEHARLAREGESITII